MRIGLLVIALIALAAAHVDAQAPAATQGTAQENAPTAQEQSLIGTYTQKQVCKGDGSDPIKQIVRIGESEVDSNFGPCMYTSKTWSGNVLKAEATCKSKSGTELEVSIAFTLNADKTVGFVEENSQYKSVLYPCPPGAKTK